MSFVHVFFGDLSYVEYRKESIISWDSLLGELWISVTKEVIFEFNFDII